MILHEIHPPFFPKRALVRGAQRSQAKALLDEKCYRVRRKSDVPSRVVTLESTLRLHLRRFNACATKRKKPSDPMAQSTFGPHANRQSPSGVHGANAVGLRGVGVQLQWRGTQSGSLRESHPLKIQAIKPERPTQILQAKAG